MFDDDDRIAAVDELVQHLQQQTDVLEMKPRRRLIQDVERAARVALRKLGRELDALALAARQRRAGLPERQVAEAHLLNGPELLVDLSLRYLVVLQNIITQMHIHQIQKKLNRK